MKVRIERLYCDKDDLVDLGPDDRIISVQWDDGRPSHYHVIIARAWAVE